METVAFYSYKGGVGRSLLLVNAARFLASHGLGVVAFDFDLEAPGLHYKFLAGQSYLDRGGAVNSLPRGGVVPYLLATMASSAHAPALDQHVINLPLTREAQGWMQLMPAGPAPHHSYWAALKELGDKLRPGDPSGRGLMALLDLRARIEEELKPDYLLIDARTGVTEFGGLATTILADTVVCMFVMNHESLDGAITVAEGIRAAPRLHGQRPLRIIPVGSRTTGKNLPVEFVHNIDKLETVSAGPTLTTFLPHDSSTGSPEEVIGGGLHNAYSELFEVLFPGLGPLPKGSA